jgi:hypothetical protein
VEGEGKGPGGPRGRRDSHRQRRHPPRGGRRWPPAGPTSARLRPGTGPGACPGRDRPAGCRVGCEDDGGMDRVEGQTPRPGGTGSGGAAVPGCPGRPRAAPPG